MNRLLVIEQDDLFFELLTNKLQQEHIGADRVSDAQQAIAKAVVLPYALVLLSLPLTGTDGVYLIKSIRALTPVPILVLSAHCDLSVKTEAYRCGADDFLDKPAHLEECMLKIYALMRRYTELNRPPEKSGTMVLGQDLLISPEHRRVYHRGEQVALTRKEFDILYLLAKNLDRVLTYQQIYEQVWGIPYKAEKNRVSCHVKGLRKKLAETACIRSVYGVGYRIENESA